MDNKLIDKAKEHATEVRKHVLTAMNEMQSSRIGGKKRSKREIGIMFRELAAIPTEERQATLFTSDAEDAISLSELNLARVSLTLSERM